MAFALTRRRREQPIFPTIATTIGAVRGKWCLSIYGETFFSFEGVPYAKRILEAVRFQSPEPIDFIYRRVIDCTKPPDVCAQLFADRIFTGSEECVSLNIYPKFLQTHKKLPVIVFIHGGSFTIGNAIRTTLGPDYFMMNGVVLITVGFRIGPFGFFSFRDPKVRSAGNAGLKDIILALRFINDNIHGFNGDPNNITLCGHESGSAMVQLLMMTNQCKGLFHKAILMAGFYLDVCNIDNMENRLADCLGAERAWRMNDRDLRDFFLYLPAKQLVCQNVLTEDERYRGYMYGYMPTIETYVSPTTVIVIEPVDKLATAWGNDIPVIIGHTSFEGLKRFHIVDDMDVMKQYPEYLLPFVMQTRLNYEMRAKMVDRLLRVHLPDPPKICRENLFHLLDMQSHTLVLHSLHRFLSARRKYAQAPTFLYQFDFFSEIFNPKQVVRFGPEYKSPSHAEELKYLFYIKKFPVMRKTTREGITIKRMIDMWTAFAETSDPTSEEMSFISWEPVQKEGIPQCLNIGEHVMMMNYPPYKKNLEWDKCFQEAGLKLF